MNLLALMFTIAIVRSLHPRSCVFAADLCTGDLAATYSRANTASSHFAPKDKSSNYGADRALLNNTETKDAAGVMQMGAWVAEKGNFNQWLQIELKEPAVVRGLTTQGRNGCCQQWVTRYRVLYSEDCKHWSTVGGFNVTDAFFVGNTDENTAVTNMFQCPVMAKCIRVNPLGWKNNIAMRLGILGCPLNLQVTQVTPATTAKSPMTTVATATQTQAPTPKPTQQPTQAPTTMKIKTTAKSGTGVALPTGSCIKSCKGRANGEYQSCSGCDVYTTCVWEGMFDKRPCPKRTFWDDNQKRCVQKSKTCP